MAEGFSSPIDTGLPGTPSSDIENWAVYEQFQNVFNAIRILQQKLGDYSGLGVLDPSNYVAVSPLFADSIQVQRMQAILVTASVAIGANQFVNLFSSTGLKARLADATSVATRAHGWCPAAINVGAIGIVYLQSGYRIGSGMTLGATYYLSASTPGGITTTAPAVAGTIKQEVGLALSTIDMFVQLSTPIIN